MTKRLAICVTAFLLAMMACAQDMQETDPAFFQTAEARRIGDQMLLYQRVTGGWPKNIDMAKPMSEEEKAEVKSAYNRRNDSTTDNGATTTQMLFLARLYGAPPQPSPIGREKNGQGVSQKSINQSVNRKYRDAFQRGVEYLLSGQYDNGGWPQFWPEMRDYQIHITYNDDAMVNTMTLLRDIAEQNEPFQGKLTSKKLRRRCMEAFNKGVECILKTQIRDANGRLTVWCQQHDRETFLPANARTFELASYCSQESAAIVKLLMQLPNPDDRVKQAIHSAMRWFDEHKIMGMRVERTRDADGNRDTRLVADSTAGPLWARYYDLQTEEPFVCDRDGIPRKHLEDIGSERRNGYSWYGDRPADLYKRYEKWCKKWGEPYPNFSLLEGSPKG
ncbi:MAG: pectate lyase [Prevotella sp.]|nr:pectate lyase [Prevotella sp.]